MIRPTRLARKLAQVLRSLRKKQRISSERSHRS